ncbi:MAG TPA: hypothetical protein VH988_02890 [Thermoanaerobaculia bacterium]|jgi:hypothetical protein|nr:hypothetical protein [Thermoanaerobaculia bacterium]
MPSDDLYERREQTAVKHYILQHYLERFARIVGFGWSSITYVDGFSGPWNVKSHDLKDSSFALALDELRKARITHPEINRTHFHLIYATRHPKGVEVFKEAEKRAMPEMEKLRAGAQQRKREERDGQSWLFSEIEEIPESRYYNQLRERYLGKARQGVLDLLKRRNRVPYDDAWALALEWPLVWESDLKGWIKEWQKGGALRIEGLKGQKRVPAHGNEVFLIRQP